MKRPGTLAALGRAILLAATVPFLASCASADRRPPNKANYKLDASSDRGGVIFGWRIDNASPNAIFYNAVWTCYDRATGTVCPPRDPNSEKNAFGVPQRLNLWGVTRRPNWLDANDTLGVTTYHVFLMPPGDYVLSYLTESLPQPYLPPLLRTTHDSDSVNRFVQPGGTVANSTAPRFTVRPGTMIYVGDLTFDMKAVRVPRVDQNEAAARTALAEYPNITVELKRP